LAPQPEAVREVVPSEFERRNADAQDRLHEQVEQQPGHTQHKEPVPVPQPRRL